LLLPDHSTDEKVFIRKDRSLLLSREAVA